MSTCMLITTWNRTTQLRNTLVDLLEQWTLPDEILVVDDGGEDGCGDLVFGLSEVFEAQSCDLRYLYTNNPGLALCSHARNVGIKNTDADLLLISEPECKFLTDVIPMSVDRFNECDGKQVVSAGTVYHAQFPDMDTPEKSNRLDGWVAPYTALYPRDALMAIGGWTEFDMPGQWGFDDIDLLTRLRVYGINQYIDLEIQVFHQYHDNPGRDQVGALVNDAWWKTKNYDEEFKQDPTVIIANRGQAWGIVKP